MPAKQTNSVAVAAPAEEDIPVHPKFHAQLTSFLRGGQPLMAINGCVEMARARTCIEKVAGQMPNGAWPTFTWDPSRGFTWSKVDTAGSMIPIKWTEPGVDYKDPLNALARIPRIPVGQDMGMDRAVFIFTNLHAFIEATIHVRNAIQIMIDTGSLTSNRAGRVYKRLIILLHQAPILHHELRNYAAPLTFPPANEHDLGSGIDYVGNSTVNKDGSRRLCPPDLKDRLAVSMLGLTRQQAEDTATCALISQGDWSEGMLVAIEEFKAAQIGQEGYLSYVPRSSAPQLDNIGGWDAAAAYVRRQCAAYTPAGRALKLKVPRGILALGLPGTGKSLFAKVIGRIIYEVTGQVFPTYKLNYDALFAGIVGETESNIRRLLEILDAQRRYILVVDEIEKFMGTSGLENDGGVTRKASAKVLDWLSERVLRTDDDTDYGYVIGTMNTTNGLEPEFFRRFNATFFVDLPTADVREQILRIHLRLNSTDPDALRGEDGTPVGRADWAVLVEATEDFSGSEIEQCVILAREMATAARFEDIRRTPVAAIGPAMAAPTFEQLRRAIVDTGKSTMCRVNGERINEIREWCKDRALPVHDPVSAGDAVRAGRNID
jgi:hypothetical protein